MRVVVVVIVVRRPSHATLVPACFAIVVIPTGQLTAWGYLRVCTSVVMIVMMAMVMPARVIMVMIVVVGPFVVVMVVMVVVPLLRRLRSTVHRRHRVGTFLVAVRRPPAHRTSNLVGASVVMNMVVIMVIPVRMGVVVVMVGRRSGNGHADAKRARCGSGQTECEEDKPPWSECKHSFFVEMVLGGYMASEKAGRKLGCWGEEGLFMWDAGG
jgi:hypothetical protein